MRNCLIYNFSGELDDYSHLFPNERLGRLAAILAARGVPVEVIDRGTMDDLIAFGPEFMTQLGNLGFLDTTPEYLDVVQAEAETLLKNAPCDTILMNLWQGAGFKFAVDLAHEIRRRTPAVRIFGVGQRVDWFKEHILRLTGPAFDGLVTGLGYDTVDALARGEPAAECPGMLRSNNGEVRHTPRATIDVDDYPCADYSLYQGMTGKIPLYSVTVSNQACPNRCTYCIRPENYGRRTLARTPAGVLDELTALHNRWGARHIRIEDSTPPEGALTELARAIAESDLAGKLTLSAFSRIDTNATEDFELMKAAGFRALFFGIETLDDEQLKAVRKGISFEQILDTLQRAHAAGLATVGSLIFPLPGETQASMNNTLERVRQIQPWLDSLLALPAVVYPPTEWGQHPEKYGIQLDEDYYERFAAYPLRYLLPPERWPPLPFSYPVETLRGTSRRFEDILAVYRSFEKVVRTDIGLPFIPDYYYLLADMVDKPPPQATRDLVKMMFDRDYKAIQRTFAGDR